MGFSWHRQGEEGRTSRWRRNCGNFSVKTRSHRLADRWEDYNVISKCSAYLPRRFKGSGLIKWSREKWNASTILWSLRGERDGVWCAWVMGQVKDPEQRRYQKHLHTWGWCSLRMDGFPRKPEQSWEDIILLPLWETPPCKGNPYFIPIDVVCWTECLPILSLSASSCIASKSSLS